jgi:hypothetical protein
MRCDTNQNMLLSCLTVKYRQNKKRKYFYVETEKYNAVPKK